jgi:hypothetical protein
MGKGKISIIKANGEGITFGVVVGKTFRFSVPSALWKHLQVGDKVLVTVKREVKSDGNKH